MTDTRNKFNLINKGRYWRGKSKSGPGSDPELPRGYLNIVAEFITNNRVHSVVDIGCGDRALSRTIDWSGVDYTGIYIIPELVGRLNNTFGRHNIRFVCLDLAVDDLPSAYLCLIKDVLQHLPNESVRAFLAKMPLRYENAIITNDMIHEECSGRRNFWKTHYIKPVNLDITTGGYKPLGIKNTPFQLDAKRLAQIPLRLKGRRVLGEHLGTVFETKEVLLWQRDGKAVPFANRRNTLDRNPHILVLFTILTCPPFLIQS